MVRKKDECKIEYREKMRDGNGTVEITNLISDPSELYDKGRLFSNPLISCQGFKPLSFTILNR